ncbi:protein of unknown function [Nitrospira japonica]|uniref:Uncharacterized protein n=1 Tax=Nitrospira japonica TaxID=1325564 RepID=A0A1W1I352_9BACT|nr:protein of unknown function [Nitrospira japonica]
MQRTNDSVLSDLSGKDIIVFFPILPFH